MYATAPLQPPPKFPLVVSSPVVSIVCVCVRERERERGDPPKMNIKAWFHSNNYPGINHPQKRLGVTLSSKNRRVLGVGGNGGGGYAAINSCSCCSSCLLYSTESRGLKILRYLLTCRPVPCLHPPPPPRSGDGTTGDPGLVYIEVNSSHEEYRVDLPAALTHPVLTAKQLFVNFLQIFNLFFEC